MEKQYVGLLVTAKGVYSSIARLVGRGGSTSYQGALAALVPAAGCEANFVPFGDRDAREVLREVTIALMHKSSDLVAIGASTYGPLRRVDLASRDSDDPGYGVVNPSTVHQTLQGLDVYRTVQRAAEHALDRRFTKVRVHSDVVGGAFAEQHRRLNCTPSSFIRPLSPSDTLAFVHIEEGIGGATIKDDAPQVGALHQEFGYMAVTIDPDDEWAVTMQIEAEASGTMVVLEDLASEQALKERARSHGISCEDERWLERLPPHHWHFESGYLAQLCGTLTMMHAPHQIVLDSPFLSDQLLAEIRTKFKRFLFRKRQSRETLGLYLGYAEVMDVDRFIQRAVRPAPMLFGALCLAVREDLGLP